MGDLSAPGAIALDRFDALLSIPGREELRQVSMACRVVPSQPWIPAVTTRKADADDGEKRDAGEVGTSGEKAHSQSQTFALPRDAWSTPVNPNDFAQMTVIGFWEPGKGLDPLGALHLIAGSRGPSARVVADIDKTKQGEDEMDPAQNTSSGGVEALHSELVAKKKTAVVSIGGGRREIHLCAVQIDAPSADLEIDAPVETQNAMRSLARKKAQDGKITSLTFLAFETKAMAPFHYAPVLVHKQLPVIFDLDETLLQAFTIQSLDRRAESIRRAHEESAAVSGNISNHSVTNANEKVLPVLTSDKSQTDKATDAAGKTVAGAVGSAGIRETAKDQRDEQKRREEDMGRLKKDRVMLLQYVAENYVVDGKGVRHVASQESATTAPGEVTFRPVIRLPSPHLKGGQIIFTRIDPTNKGTSMVIHVRPGWEEMYSYLAGLDRLPPNNSNQQVLQRPVPRCCAFVCTMSDHVYAQEMWRLLDPRGLLISSKDLSHKVVSIKQGAELKTIEKAVGGSLGREMCVILDDRTSVWEEQARAHILAVAPFMPYATDTGPGLSGEAPGEAGVLGAARRMIDKTRMDVFMSYEKFAKFHLGFPNATFEPPMNALVAVEGSGGVGEGKESHGEMEEDKEKDSKEDKDKDSDGDKDSKKNPEKDTKPSTLPKSNRPQPPDVAGTLPVLMNAHAKEAAKAVAQMGGAARSAAGAGSRLNAMLGGIAAPRPSFKGLAGSSFTAGSSFNKGSVNETDKEKTDKDKEDDGSREKAKAAAVEAIKLAAEESFARREQTRLEREAAVGNQSGEKDDFDKTNTSMDAALESDEERTRLEDLHAEAALGESDSDEGEPDERVRTNAAALVDDADKNVGQKKSTPQKKRNTCNTCTSQGLDPADHFRYCTKCPFHPKYKGKHPRKLEDKDPDESEDDEKSDDALEDNPKKSSSESEDEAEELERRRRKRKSSRVKHSEGDEEDKDSDDGEADVARTDSDSEGEGKKKGGSDEPEDGSEEFEAEDEDKKGEGGNDDTVKGKRKRLTVKENQWLPSPEETGESEIPKTSPRKPALKKQKTGKSQREAMLKKLSGKKR
tara:strand:- start:5881 stop:9102 length:3222 start_codon:yes stop_codon:yes gene_type:complete